MHHNFKDLNPEYTAARHVRAVDLANRIMMNIGVDLKGMVRKEKNRLFD